MKKSTLPRTLLTLVLTLALALVPLGSVAAEEAGVSFDFPLTRRLNSQYDHPEEQWFESDLSRSTLAASLTLDLFVSKNIDNMNWDYPVVIAQNDGEFDLYYFSDGQTLCWVRFRSDAENAIYNEIPLSDINAVLDGQYGPTEEFMFTLMQLVGPAKYSFLASETYKEQLSALVNWMVADEGDGDAGADGVSADESYVLPDPAAWLGVGDQFDSNAGNGSIAFVWKKDNLSALEGYAELLKDERFGLEMIDTRVDEYWNIPSPIRLTYYLFDRVDGALSPYGMDAGSTHIEADVIVIIQEQLMENSCGMGVYYNPSFHFVNAGDVYEYPDASGTDGGTPETK